MAVLKNQVPPTPKPSPYGNGGVNYNTADTEMKKKLAQSQIKINQNPSYVQNETSRALQVIKNREAQGMDTSAQQKYLTQNLGYKPPQSATTGTVTSAYTQPTVTATQPKSYSDEAKQLFEGMRNRINQPNKEFSYDPNSDPAYQAALARARSNIDAGNSQAQAEMNRRGILNSTITSDRMSEISSNEMGRVENEVVPQLMQQAYQRYIDQQMQDQQQFQNMSLLAEMYNKEDQRGFDNRLAEGELTGNYTSPEVRQYVQQILGLKQQAESKGVTAQQRAELSSQADGLRAQLQSLGIDPSKFAANVNYNTASQVNPGVRTLAGQQFDLLQKQANNNAAIDWSKLAGQILSPQTNWDGYQRQIQRGNNPLTLEGQQFLLDRQSQLSDIQQRAIDNAWKSSEALGYVTEELSRLRGIPAGIPTFEARKYEQAMQLDRDRMGMDQYQFDQQQGLREAQFGFDMANAGGKVEKPNYTITPKGLIDMVTQQYGIKDMDTEQVKIPDGMRQQIAGVIASANMSLEDKIFTAKTLGIELPKN